jgi:glucose-6-phosphate 1-dehydrogenase
MDVQPTVFVIFGGAGDLTRRKITPALFDLFSDKSMPGDFSILVLDREEYSDETLRRRLQAGVKRFSRNAKPRPSQWREFASRIRYVRGDFEGAKTYASLAEELARVDKEKGARATRIFYLATPPRFFGVIPTMLDGAGLSRDRGRSRLVVEKPIGRDLDSARELNRALLKSFHESQLYRIDHYLGKETVQNILAFRFANPMFEPIWNRRYVDHVTITVAEEVGVEHRSAYYEHAGALRDMCQNHLLQLLCLVAMEPMVTFDADEVRNKKVDVLHAVRPIPFDRVHEFAARGQYGPGWIRSKKVPGYREEEGVAAESQTETFAALRLFVDNWRWQGVPFYLRTGKRMTRPVSEIVIHFRAVPHQSFPPEAALEWQPARLVMGIQPDEGIILQFQAKQPGRKVLLRPVDMRFGYEEAFELPSPDAYETLLWDVMLDDATLFMRADQIEAAWAILTPVLEAWAGAEPSDFPNYAAGTYGPEAAEALLAQLRHSWSLPVCLADRRKSSE